MSSFQPQEQIFKTQDFNFFILYANTSPTDFQSYPSQIHGLTGCLISWSLLDSSIMNSPLSPAWKGLIFYADGKFHPYAKRKAHLSSQALEGFLESMEIIMKLGALEPRPITVLVQDSVSRDSESLALCASKPSQSPTSFMWTFCSQDNKIGSPSQRKHRESSMSCECI